MDNWMHWALIIMATGLFMLGSKELALVESGQENEGAYPMWWIITTVGMCLFSNSTLTLYVRCNKELKNRYTNNT